MNIIILIILGIYALVSTFAYIKLFKQSHFIKTQSQYDNAALERKILQHELITAINSSFNSIEETDILIQNALFMICMSMKLSRASISRIDRETNTIEFAYEWSDSRMRLPPLSLENHSFTNGNIFYDTFITRGDVYLTCDNIKKHPEIMQALQQPRLKACIFVPINVYGHIWGIMGIEQCGEWRAWRDVDTQIMLLAAGAMVNLLVKADTEAALIQAKELAELSNQTKTIFLSQMSHEMLISMNEIIGMTTIAQNSDDNKKNRNCLERINDASEKLLGIINDILDMTRIEAGKFDMYVNEFDFIGMLNRVTYSVKIKAQEKNQVFNIIIDPQCPARVISDEQRIAQVFTNLLSNAVKFTPDNGNITLTALLLTKKDRRNIIRFNIIDSGIGISDEQKKRLFVPFKQHSYGGSGLGLVITKNIIETLGGKIWFKSEPGIGSDFAFELPLDEAKAKFDLALRKDLKIENIFLGKRMLVAEDIDINREIVKIMLERTGIEIDFAHNGLELYEKYRAKTDEYDLILSDINMPELDGYEATKKIREFEADINAKIPIIAMTAHVTKNDVEKCIICGMNDHLGKPLEIKSLIEKLSHYLNKS
jgi:signal transduction histidine kinase/ActR/RegA family two-component response regulator